MIGFWQKRLTEERISSADLVHLKGLGLLFVTVDEAVDIGFELGGRSVNTALELLSGQLGEPALDLVDLRRQGRPEVDMIMRAAGKPGSDPGGRVIVHDDVDIESVGDGAVDLLQKVDELGCTVPLSHLPMTMPEARSSAANSDVVPCRT